MPLQLFNATYILQLLTSHLAPFISDCNFKITLWLNLHKSHFLYHQTFNFQNHSCYLLFSPVNKYIYVFLSTFYTKLVIWYDQCQLYNMKYSCLWYGSEIRAKLEGTTGYAGLIVAPTEGISLRPRLCLPFGQKTQHNYEVFWCFSQLYVFCRNLSNLKRKKTVIKSKIPKKTTKNLKFYQKY